MALDAPGDLGKIIDLNPNNVVMRPFYRVNQALWDFVNAHSLLTQLDGAAKFSVDEVVIALGIDLPSIDEKSIRDQVRSEIFHQYFAAAMENGNVAEA